MVFVTKWNKELLIILGKVLIKTKWTYLILISLLIICKAFADEPIINVQLNTQEQGITDSTQVNVGDIQKDTLPEKGVNSSLELIPTKVTRSSKDNRQSQENRPTLDNRPPAENRLPVEVRPPVENRPQIDPRPQTDYRPPNDGRPATEIKPQNIPPKIPVEAIQIRDKFNKQSSKSQKGDNNLNSNGFENSGVKNLQVFPDEYSDLDEQPKTISEDNDVVLKTLEHARQKYIQAILHVDRGDTVTASEYFIKAIEILNRLTSFAGIEENRNFTDLAKSIMDDYENFVQSIENLNDDSPFFAVRDKLFKQIDISEPNKVPNIKTLEIEKDSSLDGGSTNNVLTGIALVGAKPILAEPKSIVIPLDENEEVMKNISFLTEEGKKGGKRFFKKWLERTTKWFPMMRRIAAEEEMPEELIYLSLIESGLKPDAVSYANAVGLWQFLRTTGQDYDLNLEPSSWVDERRDPEKSTRAAMRFLKYLHSMFGDWHLALAAYNCGGGRVRRTLKNFGTDSSGFWDIRDKLPKQTQQYVPLYIATAKIALNPIAYGFNTDSLKFEDEYSYDTYLLNEPVSLSVIAKCVDTTREVIQQLNPELLRTITPPDRDTYTIKIPKNKVQLFVANYSTLSAQEKQPWIEHKVGNGESIAKIARDYDVSRNEIASANGLPSYRSKVRAGTILKIPVDKDYFAEKKRLEEDKVEMVAVSTKIAGDQKATTHTVKPGESLYSIANRYGIKMTDLRSLNNIPFDDDNIAVGQKLVVSQSDITKTSIASDEHKENGNIKFVRHKVKGDETLHAIAENYNVSIEAIKAANNLHDDKILQGQMLAIEIPVTSTVNFGSKTFRENSVTHEVKPDETLGTIASIYGVTEENLAKWNPDKVNGTTVFAGTLLKIEVPEITKGSSQPLPKSVNKSPKYYTVKRGDTLSSLSRKFGVSINELQKRNQGLEPDKLRVGQRVRIQ